MKNYIRELRLEHGGLSQQELANLVGCRQQTIVALEQGFQGSAGRGISI